MVSDTAESSVRRGDGFGRTQGESRYSVQEAGMCLDSDVDEKGR